MITLRPEEGMRIEEGFCLRRECINRNWKNASLAEVEVRNIGLYGFQEKGKSQDCGACKSH